MQYGAMSYKVRSHEDDEEDDVANDPSQSDHIVRAAVEDAVDDVIHVVLVVCHRQLDWWTILLVERATFRVTCKCSICGVLWCVEVDGPTK